MKRKLFGLSCLSYVLLCVAGGFLALFVGSVLFSQVQAGSPVASATPVPASQQTAPGGSDSQLGITMIPPASSIPVDASPTPTYAPPMVSATPGLAPLGTMSYPLTVTAEFAIDATRVKGFQDGIAATRTANAEQAQIAHITLTAAASTPDGK